MEYITIYVDGNGDGHSIALFPRERFYIFYEPGATNNVTEYNAILLALFVAEVDSFLSIKTDSQLAIGHLEKGWKINHKHIQEKVDLIRQVQEIKNISMKLEWIPRKQNVSDRVLRRHLKVTRKAAQVGQTSGLKYPNAVS